jgi:hypothetical protein
VVSVPAIGGTPPATISQRHKAGNDNATARVNCSHGLGAAVARLRIGR